MKTLIWKKCAECMPTPQVRVHLKYKIGNKICRTFPEKPVRFDSQANCWFVCDGIGFYTNDKHIVAWAEA